MSVADKLRIDRAIKAVESAGFEQSAFVSNASNRQPVSSSTSMEKDSFEFGTSVEKASLRSTNGASEKVIQQIENDGLCHPDWFQNPEEREAKWLKYLTQFRKRLASEAKS